MDLFLLISLIIFVSVLAHAVFGFGTALIAMPLLSALLGIKLATPTVALVMTTANFFILSGAWAEIDRKEAVRLLIASFAGFLPGLWIVHSVPERVVMTGLGLILIGYALYRVAAPRLPPIEAPGWSVAAGVASGILGAAYNTNGPPVVLYAAAKRWSPGVMRATLQGFFVPSSLAICAAHGLSGLWSLEVGRLYLWSLPAMLAGWAAGTMIARRIEARRFERLLDLVLLGLGVFLLIH